MTQKRRNGLQNTCAVILLAIAVSGPIVVSTGGCNTSQPPDLQVKDSQVTTRVKAKLASDVRASSLMNIDINTTNGVVTLAGQVENANVKQSAETVAATVPGVVRVNNNLQVAPTVGSVNR